MQHDPKTGPPDPKLAAELFAAVELEQGYAFISDGCEVLSARELVWLARGSLQHSEAACRALRRFLKSHDRYLGQRGGE